jgi:hypothetical protein
MDSQPSSRARSITPIVILPLVEIHVALSDLAVVFAFDAASSEGAAVDGAGSASFSLMVTQVTKHTMNSVLVQALLALLVLERREHARPPWETDMDLGKLWETEINLNGRFVAPVPSENLEVIYSLPRPMRLQRRRATGRNACL